MKSKVDTEFDTPTWQVIYKQLHKHQEQSIPVPGLTIFVTSNKTSQLEVQNW